ncbi:helix-turn-helix domain-containing protein [Marinomonas epiphytica]
MDTIHHRKTPEPKINLIDGHYRTFNFSRHYHLDYHFGLFIDGKQSFNAQGTKHKAGKGDIVIMPPDVLHDGRSLEEEGYKSCVFSVEPSWLTEQDFADKSIGIHFTTEIIHDKHLFNKLFYSYQLLSKSELSQLEKDCLPYETFAAIIQRYSKKPISDEFKLGDKNIRQLREFLIAHLSEPITLRELADLCGLSTSQFQRHFKNKMGITPYAWLSRLRLEQSLYLIKACIPCVEVALQVGFFDQAHFSKAFKRAFGIPPSKIS